MSTRFYDCIGRPRMPSTGSVECATDDELSVMFTNMKFTKTQRLRILREMVKRLEKLTS